MFEAFPATDRLAITDDNYKSWLLDKEWVGLTLTLAMFKKVRNTHTWHDALIADLRNLNPSHSITFNDKRTKLATVTQIVPKID